MLTTRQEFILSRPRLTAPTSFIHEPMGGKPVSPEAPVAFTAVAATNLLTSTAHGLTAGRKIRFSSTTALPAGLGAATDYFVIASGLTVNDFKVSATLGGSEVDITDAGTGTHTWLRYLAGSGSPVVFSLAGATVTAAAATNLFTAAAHALAAGDRLRFGTTGTLPAGLLAGVDYFVIADGLTANNFRIAIYSGGAAIDQIDLADAGTGTHSYVIASVLTAAGHGLVVNRRLRLSSAGTLPVGLTAGIDYYVLASRLTADRFKLAVNPGGVEADLTDPGTGAHSYTAVSEQQEVADYLAGWLPTGSPSPAPTYPASIVMIADLETYHAAPAFKTWWMDEYLSREAQFDTRRADLTLASEATIPPSATSTGIGSAAPVSPVAAAAPDPVVADVVPNVETGTLGSAITVSLSCATGGSTIHVQFNGSSWFNYAGHIPMDPGDSINFYATAPGFSPSPTDTFQNV